MPSVTIDREMQKGRPMEPETSDSTARLTSARARRLSLFDRSHEFSPLIGIETESGRFLVDTTDEVLGRILFVKEGRRETRTLADALSVLDSLDQADHVSGRVFVEVGGNIGTTTVCALLTHRFARAVTFEPEPRNVRLLRANALLNELDDLLVIDERAVSDHEGEARLLLDPLNSGGHRMLSQEDGTPKHTLIVPCTTLDAAAAAGAFDPGEVGMLWIDAEGHDGHVILGAKSLLHRGTPIVFEIYPARLRPTRVLDDLLAVLADSYDGFVDLRQGGVGAENEARPGPTIRPFAELRTMVEDDDAVTDVLAVRRP
jgi:FkbM family methyltransferase